MTESTQSAFGRRWLACLCLFCLAACATSPPPYQVLTDQAYGSHPRQALDIYIPTAPAIPSRAGNAPVIFMVHGGGWRRGDKANNAVVENKAKRWLQRGFVFISTNYRLLPDADPLTQATDVAAAIAYAQHNASQWGADAKQFILMGHSAGAHLVSLLNSDPALANAQGTEPWLGTIAIDSAGFDIEKVMRADRVLRLYKNAFGNDVKYWHQASPIVRLEKAGPPLLAICSSVRKDKPCDQAEAYAAKARTLGMRVEVLPVPLSHRQANVTLGEDGDYTEAVEAFMDSLRPVAGHQPANP